jgi:hypothetical protein
MKKKDIVNLFNTLLQINIKLKELESSEHPIFPSIKFKYALAKINQQIESEISILSKFQQDNEIIKKDYIMEINKFCSDNNGVLDNFGNWSFPNNNDKETFKLLQEKTIELQKKYDTQLKEFDAKNKEFQELLEEDSTITNLYKIMDITIIPDCITTEQMSVLMQYGIID